ncbi:MAG: histidinol-phosphate transaminase [FCB group bacterium]|jgi:histidinol-phosphate aminotransferase
MVEFDISLKKKQKMPAIPVHILNMESYKPGRAIEDVKREFGLERIIKLASNENPLGVSPMAIQAMLSSIHEINRYPDISSMLLRNKLSEVFNLKFDNILTGHGSEAIMQSVLRTFLLQDDEVITSEGSFVGFYVMAKAQGLNMKLVPLKNYTFDLKAIADNITSKTKLIYLVNPNNPTGTSYTKEEFDEFIDIVPSNILVIVDEAYYEFVQENLNYPNSLQFTQKNIITLRTFSKAYGLAGIRVGYGFADDNLVKYILKVRLPFEPGIPSQAAGVAALLDTQFLDYYLKLNNCGKEYLYNFYERQGIEYIKSDANFIMNVFDSEETVNNITQKLMRRGIIIRPLKPFGLPHCIRVTIGLPEENEIFAKNLREIL